MTAVSTLGSKIHGATEATLEGIVQVKENPDALYKALNVAYYTTMGVQQVATGATSSLLIHQQAAGGISVIDVFEIFSVLDYWINGKFIKDATWEGFFNLLGNICMGIATMGGIVLWAAEMGFYKLADAAVKIGSWIINVGSALLFLVRFTAMAGFTLFCANAVKDAVLAKNDKERTKAILDVAALGSSAVLQILFMAAANVWAIVLFGVISGGLGIASFLYGHFNKA